MAVSAFKSTTRRRGIQGTPNDQESVGPPPRTPSDNITAHHHKLKYHRRSSSFTDFSPYSRHSGDSPRFRATRFLDRQLSESDLGKNKPIDDTDGTGSIPRHAGEVTHRLGSPQVIHEDSAMRPAELRQSISGQDKYHRDHPEGQVNINAENAMRPVLQRSISGHDKNRRDHPEGQVEEKIIQAVHAQNKSRRSDSLPRDQSELYNIIKAEVFDVVADIKDAIENPQEKALLLDDSTCSEAADNSRTSFSEEIVKVFRYVCKGYAAKIDEAQKEVRQLRSQLAEKEKVCLDLTNLINEMIPESGALQPVGKLLKEDKGRQVFRYVAEQGKGASQPPAARSGSILDDDTRLRRLSSQQILLELDKEAQQGGCRNSATKCNSGIAENKDGLVLPWLQWEEATVQRHLNRDMAEEKQECALLHSSQEEVSFTQKKPQCDEEQVSDGMHQRHRRKDNYITVSESSKYTRGSSIKSSHVADSSLLYIQSTELISERIQFRARVDAGELLLCIGTLHIL